MNKRLLINLEATKQHFHLETVRSSALMARVVTGMTPDNRVNLCSEWKEAWLKTTFQKAQIKSCEIVVVIWKHWLNMDNLLSINSAICSHRRRFCGASQGVPPPPCLISSYFRPGPRLSTLVTFWMACPSSWSVPHRLLFTILHVINPRRGLEPSGSNFVMECSNSSSSASPASPILLHAGKIFTGTSWWTYFCTGATWGKLIAIEEI